MRKKHRKTYEAIYHKPTLASISWKDIESLFVALGAEIIEGSGSRISVVLNNEVAVFHRPHPQKEAVKGAVGAVRECLRLAGVDTC
ncbi:MAG: type II toxin-antitoxin system HicA family toxin [Candidatus Electrothrix sp. AR3]|nr:type II toxin-antitoxin system HicA family toxin [Candidatus Electrothrix sp. AR3]